MTGPSIRVGALTLFNDVDAAFRIMGFDGWYGVAQPRAELVPNGAVAGAVAVGPWDSAEAYYTLRGLITSTDRAALIVNRRQLLAALPSDTDAPIEVLGNDEDVDLQVFVRLYDKPDINFDGPNLVFVMPLVATDPLKYTVDELDQTMGVFTGSSWFRTYTDLTIGPANPGFEVDTSGWVAGTNTTLARVTSQFDTGVASMSMTRTTSTGDASAATTSAGVGTIPVHGSRPYTFTGRFRADSTGRTVRIDIRWYDKAGALLSTTTGTNATDVTTDWVTATTVATAPGNAVKAALVPTAVAAAVNEIHYVDTFAAVAKNVRTYFLSGSKRVRTYEQQAAEVNEFPLAATLTSAGDAVSRRLVVQVTGPVTQGDWAIVNEKTGERLFADLSLVAGQTIRFDCLTQTTTLDGAPIDRLVFGDFLTLEPGANVYRLVAGTQTDGFARITARPAYK